MLLLGKVCWTQCRLWEIPEFQDFFVFLVTRLVEYISAVLCSPYWLQILKRKLSLLTSENKWTICCTCYIISVAAEVRWAWLICHRTSWDWYTKMALSLKLNSLFSTVLNGEVKTLQNNFCPLSCCYLSLICNHYPSKIMLPLLLWSQTSSTGLHLLAPSQLILSLVLLHLSPTTI